MISAKSLLEQRYQEMKSIWSLPPVDPKWKKFAVEVMKQYATIAIVEYGSSIMRNEEVSEYSKDIISQIKIPELL